MQALAPDAHVPLASWSPLLGLLTPAPSKSGVFAMCGTAGAKPRMPLRLEDRATIVEDGGWRGRRALPSDYFGAH